MLECYATTSLGKYSRANKWAVTYISRWPDLAVLVGSVGEARQAAVDRLQSMHGISNAFATASSLDRASSSLPSREQGGAAGLAKRAIRQILPVTGSSKAQIVNAVERGSSASRDLRSIDLIDLVGFVL